MIEEELLKKIKALRKQQGLSLRDFGTCLGVSGQYVSMIERGKAPLKMDDYFKICEVLNISPAKLLIEDNQECETLVEKIYALSERDFRLVATMVELM